MEISKQTYTYKTVGECQIQADVYRAPGNEIRPAILWIHGGALIMGNRETLAADQLERYIAAGFVVIAIDYRLAPETKLDQIIDDIRDAYAWVRDSGAEKFRIDPERIAVIGHSAGGYLTLMAGFCVMPRPRALVAFYGYGDIVGAWYSEPDTFYRQFQLVTEDEARHVGGETPYTGAPFGSASETRFRFYLYCRQQGIWPSEVGGHDPAQEADWFTAYCPIRNVTPDYPPTMLIHGEQDTDVPFEQSALMANELARQGVDHLFIALAGQGHGFDGKGMSDPIVANVFDQIEAFLNQSLA